MSDHIIHQSIPEDKTLTDNGRPPTLDDMRVRPPEPEAKRRPPVAGMPALPEPAQLDPELSADASPWLDRYLEFSRLWSPRAFDGFHEATALWALSTVAGRRVSLHFGGRRYTNLYIALTARTSLYAKSTTARIAAEILRALGLLHMLAADDSTPQAFVSSLTSNLPGNWDQLPSLLQRRILDRLAFPAQKGWFFDEFGQKVSAMMREGGFMADFRGLLRKLDDCPMTYEYATVGRGTDLVEEPYLALLASLTPADLAPYAQMGGTLWGDGFWARFAFVTPPAAADRKTGRFPDGELVIPDYLTAPLRSWHQRLGVPEAEVIERIDEDGKAIGYDILRKPAGLEICTLGAGVVDAFYAYHDGLLDLVYDNPSADLDGNYTRFAEKALRVSMLLASLENGGHIEMRHWARAQQVTEHWRAGLHNLYQQINNGDLSEEGQLAEKVLAMVAERGPMTMREMYQFANVKSTVMKGVVPDLVNDGKLEAFQEGRAVRYRLIG